jgi:hypothetical protein
MSGKQSSILSFFKPKKARSDGSILTNTAFTREHEVDQAAPRSPKQKQPDKDEKSNKRSFFSSIGDVLDNDESIMGSCHKSYNDARLRKQIEYYLSDANLRQDSFYRDKIMRSSFKNGWFDMKYILTAPRIKAMSVTDPKEIVTALKSSATLETMVDDKNSLQTYLIRRKNNKPLPTWQSRTKRRRYNRYGNDYGDSDYGFGGGCYGYSGYSCDRLLECGVKPWDSDAGDVLAALHGYF